MKPAAFIPPVAVLLAGALWLGSQSASISRAEKENAAIAERIGKHKSRPTTATTDAVGGKSHSPGGSAGTGIVKAAPIDWPLVAAQMLEMQRNGGMGDSRSMVRLQQRLQEMTADELLSALDGIASAGLTDPEQQMAELMIVGPLTIKDPELALKRFLPRLENDGGPWNWHLGVAVKSWAQKDPQAASGWLDGQIAAGRFESKSLDGKSPPRLNVEGSLLAVLIGSDPDAVAARLAALPENVRGGVLSHHEFASLKAQDQTAYARMVRGQLPEKERANVIANAAPRSITEGYAKVTEYLDRISATPEERTATVERAADTRLRSLANSGRIDLKEVDEMRAWADKEAPGSADRITGKVLGQLTGGDQKKQFEDSSRIALHYLESTGSDEVLSGFLEGWVARSNKEEARLLAARITDEKRRARLLETLK